MQRAVTAGLVLLCLWAPARGADDAEAVHKLLDAVEQAWAGHDRKSLESCCADRMLAIVSRPGSPLGAFVGGKKEVLAQTAKVWTRVVSHQFVERKIVVEGGMAWMWLTVADKLDDGNGRLAHVLNVAVREGESWKLCLSMPQLFRPGVVVGEVPDGTPAARADLRPGDVILTVNGSEPAVPGDGRNATSPPSGGTRVVVRRGGRSLELSVGQWPGGATLVPQGVPVEPAVLLDPEKPHGVKARLKEEFAAIVTNDPERFQKVWCPAGLLAIIPPDPRDRRARLLDSQSYRTWSDEQMRNLRRDYDLAATSLADVQAICGDDVAVATGRFRSVRRDAEKTPVSFPVGIKVYVRQGEEWYFAAAIPLQTVFGPLAPPAHATDNARKGQGG
ncbi:MAG TPA: PDZ domain-containing protein [Phycisphaerae bacterium]|nr:PDZ domain-containing protein [Phycisphaerae bacterium]